MCLCHKVVPGWVGLGRICFQFSVGWVVDCAKFLRPFSLDSAKAAEQEKRTALPRELCRKKLQSDFNVFSRQLLNTPRARMNHAKTVAMRTTSSNNPHTYMHQPGSGQPGSFHKLCRRFVKNIITPMRPGRRTGKTRSVGKKQALTIQHIHGYDGLL